MLLLLPPEWRLAAVQPNRDNDSDLAFRLIVFPFSLSATAARLPACYASPQAGPPQ